MSSSARRFSFLLVVFLAPLGLTSATRAEDPCSELALLRAENEFLQHIVDVQTENFIASNNLIREMSNLAAEGRLIANVDLLLARYQRQLAQAEKQNKAIKQRRRQLNNRARKCGYQMKPGAP